MYLYCTQAVKHAVLYNNLLTWIIHTFYLHFTTSMFVFQKMSQKQQTSSSSSSVADADKEKDENQNKRVGLLKQFTNLLSKSSSNSKSEASKKTSTSAPVAASAAGTTSPQSSSSSSVTSSATKLPPASSSTKTMEPEPESVTDLKVTLQNTVLRDKFRTFLRVKLDQNKSDNPEHKKMFEQWLEFVLICDKVFELPETEVETRTGLMIQIGSKFLGKPPDGYNMALKSQINRKELLNHCKSLEEKVPNVTPDQELLKDGYEFIFSKLDQKHDIFRKTYVPTTTLAALVCAVL